MISPWVLIDTSFLAHRARYAMKGLSYDNLPTGVIFGVFEAIRTICFDPRVRTNKVAFFFDSDQSYRKKLFPAYKAKRNDRTEEEIESIRIMKQQTERLRTEILPDIGFPCYRQTGLESDDLIARAAEELDRGVDLAAIIVTADNDLWQCIRQRTVHWFDPGRNLYFDETGLWAHKEISPETWLTVKAITGCPGDGVPGIGGVGEGPVIEYLMGRLQGGNKKHDKILKDWQKPKGVQNRNLELIRLPHPKTKSIALPKAPEYNESHFWSQMSLLGIDSYLEGEQHTQWKNFFKGTMSPSGRQAALARRIK